MAQVQKGYVTHGGLGCDRLLSPRMGSHMVPRYGLASSSNLSYGAVLMPGDTRHVLSGGFNGVRHQQHVRGHGLTPSLPARNSSQDSRTVVPTFAPVAMARARSPPRSITAETVLEATDLSPREDRLSR